MHSEIAVLIQAWDWSYVDVDMAFEGLREENLHRRPTDKLISISEHIAHLMRSESSIIRRYLLGEPEEVWATDFMLKMPYGWPPDILQSEVDPRLQEFSVWQVKELFLAHHRDLVSRAESLTLPPEHTFDDEWSSAAPDVRTRLKFAAYHVAYHVGQIYQLRHLLGEETPEN